MIKKLGIDIVDGCQLKCIGCPNSTLDKKIRFMSQKTLKKCLLNINEKVGILRLYNFGEPLLHPKFSKMVKIINEWGNYNKLEVSTNGQCPSSSLVGLKHSKIDVLVVSCDGENAEDYERIRKGATWGRLAAFLGFAYLATPKTKHIARGIIKTSEGKEFWKLRLGGWKLETREWHPFPESAENPSGKNPSTGACRYIKKDNLYINYKGDVGPCCVYPDAIHIGNILKTKASRLVARKHKLAKQMQSKRAGVCRKCGF